MRPRRRPSRMPGLGVLKGINQFQARSSLRTWIVPRDWGWMPEEVLLGQETIGVAMRAKSELPVAQQAVIRMRDVDGWTGEEVCAALNISPSNQRLLLHRHDRGYARRS